MDFELMIILIAIIGAIFWNRTTRIGEELMDFHHSFKEGQPKSDYSSEDDENEGDFELNDITGMHNMN